MVGCSTPKRCPLPRNEKKQRTRGDRLTMKPVELHGILGVLQRVPDPIVARDVSFLLMRTLGFCSMHCLPLYIYILLGPFYGLR